jgi:PilZ domain
MDKRDAVRVPVRVKARCRCVDGVVIEGFVEDLSRSGMFFCTPEKISAGSAAAIDLEVPGDEPIRLEAEVVRVEQTSDREGMAFRFLDPQGTRKTLANFIMRSHHSTAH